MLLSRLLPVVLVCTCALAVKLGAAVPAARDAASQASPTANEQIDAADAARLASDYGAARALAAGAVSALLSRPDSEQDDAWLTLLNSAGRAAWLAQDPRTASTAWQRVLTLHTNALPDDHVDLQKARQNYALAIKALGDLAGARALEEKVLAVRTATLPDDDQALQAARANLAGTMYQLGDFTGAHAVFAKVLEVQTRTLPDDHADLQATRQNLALTKKSMGDLAGARTLERRALEINSKSLPDDHPVLQASRVNLAGTLYELGDLAGARDLLEHVLEINSRTFPAEHPVMQATRQNLALALLDLGELTTARVLFEQVLEVYASTLPEEHLDLQAARTNLALAEKQAGDHAGARVLEEKALEVSSRTLPDDHPVLRAARQNLAATLHSLGDLAGAEELEEKVLDVATATLPEDHPALQIARQNLAGTKFMRGDFVGARALGEKVLDVRTRTLSDDHPALQSARQLLGAVLERGGDLAGAEELFEKIAAVRVATLPEDHPDLQRTRTELAVVIARRDALVVRDTSAASTDKRTKNAQRCAELITSMCRSQVRAAQRAIAGSAGREAEERCSSLAARLDFALSFALGYGGFGALHELDAEAFALSEMTRGAALTSARFGRTAVGAPQYSDLRATVKAASDDIAALTHDGASSDTVDAARARRESAERQIVALARGRSTEAVGGVDLGVARLTEALKGDRAVVAFRRFVRRTVVAVSDANATGRTPLEEVQIESLCAFAVRESKSEAASDGVIEPALELVDLGPLAPIEAAIRAWRAAIGAGVERGIATNDQRADSIRARGMEVRRLVIDPLIGALGGAKNLVMVLDDVLHLVPLDALPLAESEALVGDRWRIETRATLAELLVTSPTPTGTTLAAIGGAAFNVAPVAHDAEDPMPVSDGAPARVASLLRGGAWQRGFTPLPHAGDEARGVVALYREIFGEDKPAIVLEKRRASRDALEELAPAARWLHVATHGWFAPESIRSWSDPAPLDELSGLGIRASSVDRVRGMSPMLLCGLALAGANLPENAAGRVPGLVTADELSTLDLSRCELVVLSACDTNVGERRAGQGVASLQKALQIAGARSVITSLWKVPDEVTKDLMLDFYRRLWVENKPKSQALWEAKRKLREAKDERGVPLYTTRDWAAWVLTGDAK